MPSPEIWFGKFFKRFRGGRGQAEQTPPLSSAEQQQQSDIVESTAYRPEAWTSAVHKMVYKTSALNAEENQAVDAVMDA